MLGVVVIGPETSGHIFAFRTLTFILIVKRKSEGGMSIPIWRRPKRTKRTVNTNVRGFRINVLAEFAGPQVITFLNFLRPLSSSFFMALAKAGLQMPFCSNTSSAQESHYPSQPLTHSP